MCEIVAPSTIDPARDLSRLIYSKAVAKTCQRVPNRHVRSLHRSRLYALSLHQSFNRARFVWPLRDKLRGANYGPCTDTSSNLVPRITEISEIYNEDISARSQGRRSGASLN